MASVGGGAHDFRMRRLVVLALLAAASLVACSDHDCGALDCPNDVPVCDGNRAVNCGPTQRYALSCPSQESDSLDCGDKRCGVYRTEHGLRAICA